MNHPHTPLIHLGGFLSFTKKNHMNKKIWPSFACYETKDLVQALPENAQLVKHSGLWEVRAQDGSVLAQQNSGQTLREFVIRYLEMLEELGLTDDIRIKLAVRYHLKGLLT
jgi:hypothetical protein